MLKSFISYGFCLAVLQLLIACGQPAADQSGIANDTQQADRQPEAADPADANQARTAADAETLIVAFGDSLYAGYGLDQKEGFAPELQKTLRAAGKDVRVHNAGVSGDTTAAGLRRMDFVLDSLTQKPDLVLLGLGGNDLLRGLDPKQTRANMKAMLDKLKERDIPVMITGMQAPPNLGSQYLAAFNAIYPDLAKEYDADLYPFFLEGLPGRNELILPDGVHPNAAGIDLIVKNITPAVEAALDG